MSTNEAALGQTPVAEATLVSVDPGLRACGVAVFRGGRLVRAGFVASGIKPPIRGPSAWRPLALKVAEWLGPDARPDEFVTEGQQIYLGARGVRPADLLELAGVNGALCMAVEAATYTIYLPRVWKKQASRDAMADSLIDFLTPEEAAAIEDCPKAGLNDVIHGLGIGLYHLGRLAAGPLEE